MTREQAENFCEVGGSCSMVVSPEAGIVAGHRYVPTDGKKKG